MRALTFALAVVALATMVAHADPVISTHPRLLLSAAEKTRLLAKKNANDASWQALKARADALAILPISQYKSATRNFSPPGTIYYSYQGEGWYDAALPLAIAYQMTGDVKYSNKLIELVQEMMRAQSDPANQPPNALLPIRPDNYYPARNLMSVLAFIYDYCYYQLSAPLKSQMVTLMNDYYDDTSVNGYQAQNYSWAADGNFFGGHLYGVALMGYASFGDNPRAQEMIEWARLRFDGTPGPALPPSKIPFAWRTQCFEGGQRPAVSLDFNGPDIRGTPFKGGFDFQAWSYGSEEYSRMIDYMLIVKSATGEDIITPRSNWFSQILRAEKHALFPNHFMIDPTGDWGGFQGAVIPRTLPARMAFIRAGAADGPAAQSFAYSEIAASNIPNVDVFAVPEWVDFYFGDPSRPSTELLLRPYYTGFGPNYPQGAHSPGGTNGAIPYFIMRSDWGGTATWASIRVGAQFYDDHQHYDAGNMIIARGSDYLLVSADDWKTELDAGGNPIYGRSGLLGPSLQELQGSLSNTLYFDDFGDFQGTAAAVNGGQAAFGIDEVVADELNQDFSYVRSDLSTAYNRVGDQADTPNRRLDFFYRNFLYLRAPNVFVVYDQVKALTSNNPRGPYKKHMRWHFPEMPAITGKMARVDHGQSRLFIDTVLPANATLNVVNEWTNPDPCDGSVPACVPFGDNAGTFRVEVSDLLNPLSIAFLTVLQPDANTSTGPTDTQVASLDNKMIGVVIQQSGGARSIALFNNQSGRVPAPITSTSYTFPGSGLVTHVLTGLVPNAAYAVALNNGIVSIDQNANGDRTASPSGVLRFLLSSSVAPPAAPAGLNAAAVTTTRVDMSWNVVLGATSYEIDRRAPGEGFTPFAAPAGNSFADTSVTAGQAYLYRVRAVGTGGTSGNRAPALATTVMFSNDPLSTGMVVLGAHPSQIRTAVNAVRSLAGLQAASFTDPSPVGMTIKSSNITELRTALDAALTALGLPAGGYTNSALAGEFVRAIDFQELRDRVR